MVHSIINHEGSIAVETTHLATEKPLRQALLLLVSSNAPLLLCCDRICDQYAN